MTNPLMGFDLGEVFAVAEMTGHPDRRDAEIRARFDMSAPRFFQCINWLITDPEVYAKYPMRCARLTRLRDLRAAQRSAKRLR